MPKKSQVRLTKRVVEAAQPGQCISDSEDRGFRLEVTASGTRRFVAAYRVGSKGMSSKKTIGTFPTWTVEQAREAAKEILRLAKAGINPKAKADAEVEAAAAARDAPTVASLATAYLDDYAPSQALSPNTIRHARALLATATASIGKMKVAAVAITDIRKLHGDVRAAGIKAGTKGNYQANRLLATLSKCFSLAIERGLRTDNPCKGVRKFPEDQRWRNLSEDEVGRLLAACDHYEAGQRLRPGGVPIMGRKLTAEEKAAPLALTDPLPLSEQSATDREAANALRLLLFTGARLREVLNAEWSQFDLAAGLWEKPSAHTKTNRQHRLELDGPALDLLQHMAGRKSNIPYLFPGDPKLRRKNTPVDIKTGQPKGIAPRSDLRHPWKEISAMAGLEGVRLHDLRRTTASFMLSGGASLATVGKQLGHTQASTTHRYATLAASIQGAAMGDAGRRMLAAKDRKPDGKVLAFPEASSSR